MKKLIKVQRDAIELRMKRKVQMIQQSTTDQHQILLLIFNLLLWTWRNKMPPSLFCDFLVKNNKKAKTNMKEK
jgi:hypothetical protein